MTKRHTAMYRPFTPDDAVAAVTPRRKRGARRIAWTCPENHMVAYLRVSTREQAESRAGLDAQRALIEAMANMRGWEIVEWRVDAGESGKSLDRPALVAALDDVRSGRARGIVVAKLDRLSRSVLDFAVLLTEAMALGWNVVALDLGVDLSTSAGKMVAGIMMTIAQWEREVIGERTRDGLAAKREAGVRLGRPAESPTELIALTLAVFNTEGGYGPAARALNNARIPTARGGRQWYPASVRQLLQSQDGRAILLERTKAMRCATCDTEFDTEAALDAHTLAAGHLDETGYLLSNPANAAWLRESLEQARRGEATPHELFDVDETDGA
jgi:DNA invertase Pin-like site-specific DNA recombinase